MDRGQQQDLLALLKILSDQQRLTMLGLMYEREYNTTELAGVLEISEPTVSYHLSKMHEAGLLRLRMDGNQRFYRVNEKRLATFKAYVNEIEQRVIDDVEEITDESWIDALDWSDEDKNVLKGYTRGGKLIRIPTKDKKWLIIMRWVATRFEPDVRYTEKQMNAILTAINPDYATLRRSLIEYGFMRRERGGGDYWLTPEDEGEQIS